MFTIVYCYRPCLKRLTAFILLAIFLFNLGGYLLLFQYFIYRSDSFLNEQIGKDRYKRSELVEIKIPVHLFGISNWTNYQSITGQVQLSEHNYNYVKMKITTDTMYLMVIPNYEKTRLIKENIIYAKQVSDEPLSKKPHDNFPKKPDTFKYNYQLVKYPPASVVTDIPQSTFYYLSSLDHPFIALYDPPPQALA